MSKPNPLASIVPPVAKAATPTDTATPPDLPRFTVADLDAKIAGSVTLAASMLGLKTDAILTIGESIDDVLKTAKGAAKDWTPKAFGETITAWNVAYRTLWDGEGIAPDAMNYWQTFASRAALVTLGVVEPERMAVSRYYRLFSHAFTTDKVAIVMQARPEWAEWLKTAIPANIPGPDCMAKADFTAEIASFSDKCKAANPAYEAPKARGVKPVTVAKPVNRAKADPAKPANVAKAAPIVPPIGKPSNPVATPVPTQSPMSALGAILKNGTPSERRQVATMVGLALAKANDLEAMQALYKILKPIIVAAREARQPLLEQVA